MNLRRYLTQVIKRSNKWKNNSIKINLSKMHLKTNNYYKLSKKMLARVNRLLRFFKITNNCLMVKTKFSNKVLFYIIKLHQISK